MRITSGSSCAHGLGRADEHERQLRGAAASCATCLRGSGCSQPADPDEVALGQREALARAAAISRVGRGYIDESGASGITTIAPARGRGGRPHRRPPPAVGTITRTARCTARWRKRRRGAGAQVLAAALERGQVVKRDDHRARAVQHRPLHPGRVEQVGAGAARGRSLSIARHRVGASLAGLAAGSASSDRCRRGSRVGRLSKSDPHELAWPLGAPGRYPPASSKVHGVGNIVGSRALPGQCSGSAVSRSFPEGQEPALAGRRVPEECPPRYHAGLCGEDPPRPEPSGFATAAASCSNGSPPVIGCSTSAAVRARFAAELARAGLEVLGVGRRRRSPCAAPGAARRARPAARSTAKDPGRLQDASFDAVWAGEVIEHVLDTAAWLSEVRRVLRPGGACCSAPRTTTPARCSPWPSRRAPSSGISTRAADHLRFYTRRSLAGLLADFGFGRDRVRGAGGLPGARRGAAAKRRARAVLSVARAPRQRPRCWSRAAPGCSRCGFRSLPVVPGRSVRRAIDSGFR